MSEENEFFTNLLVKHLCMTDEQGQKARDLACEFHGPLDLDAVSVHWLAALFVKGGQVDRFAGLVEEGCDFAVATAQTLFSGMETHTLSGADEVSSYAPLADVQDYSLLSTLQAHVMACADGSALFSSYPAFTGASLFAHEDMACVMIAVNYGPPAYRGDFTVGLTYGEALVAKDAALQSQMAVVTLIDMANDFQEWAQADITQNQQLTVDGPHPSAAMH